MIAQLRGRLVAKGPTEVVVDVHGVGYHASVPLSTYYHLPPLEAEVLLYTSTHVREDTLVLYGFLTREEKAAFELLCTVSGIGPRLATNILSGISATELVPAISTGNVVRLQAVPGVGKKTAERIIVELKEKAGRLALARVTPPEPGAAGDGLVEDVVSALVNLGYPRQAAARVVGQAARARGGAVTFEVLVKEALKQLAEGARG